MVLRALEKFPHTDFIAITQKALEKVLDKNYPTELIIVIKYKNFPYIFLNLDRKIFCATF